jgi:acetoin utilization deacetylase AcuC-like enzyme
MTIAYITHPACSLHHMGEAHPESPARLSVIEDRLLETGFEFALRRFESPAATREQLARVHDPAYVERIFTLAPDRDLVWLDHDTAMNPHSLDAALHAAGAVVLAVIWCWAVKRAVLSVACARPAIMPSGAAAWDSAYSTMWRSVAHALDRYRCNGSR